MAQRHGAAVVFDHHDLMPELFLARFGERKRVAHRLMLLLERQSLAAADVVLSSSDSYAEIARTRGRKHPEDIFVVRNGPDLRHFRPSSPDPSRTTSTTS